MENLNAENIINEIQSLIKALKDCGGWVKRGNGEGWFNHEILADTLALIKSQEQKVKELTEENERLEGENLPVLVDGKEVGTWDGIVHIFCCGRAKQIILTANGDESDRFLSLDDCLDEIECDKENEYAIVIIEEGLHGDIYKFGQYSSREWHKCGSSCGFW